MRKNYDFSKGVRNPYAKKLREQRFVVVNGKVVDITKLENNKKSDPNSK